MLHEIKLRFAESTRSHVEGIPRLGDQHTTVVIKKLKSNLIAIVISIYIQF
jgi:hypothetical protein